MIAFRITYALGVNKDDVRHVLAFLAVDELHIAARNSVRNREVDEKLLLLDGPVLNAVRLSLLGSDSGIPRYVQTDGPEFWAPLLYFLILSCIGLQIAIGVQIHRSVGE